MKPILTDFYERVRVPGGDSAHEDPAPPERWMQQLWRHQRIHRERLRTLDGQPVQVLHPGFWNREPGPDFRDAVIRIGPGPARRGDVELDREVSGWRSHRHEGNPAYAGVLLHVVWNVPAAAVAPPVLALRPYLDSPVEELASWLETEAPGLLPGNLPGRCCAPLRDLPPGQFVDLVQQAALVRLRIRSADFAVRARAAGWEQALWEGLAAALGYKHNVWPFLRLAELTPVGVPGAEEDASAPHSPLEWEARLLGLSGLLPPDLPRGEARTHSRRLWDLWWRDRDAWEGRILPAFLWRLGGVRPANHPQRRIVLAARWRAAGIPSAALQDWLATDAPRGELVSRLGRILTPPDIPGDYWRRHATLRSGASPAPMPLLGGPRLCELALNVILPWLRARADAGNRSDLLAEVERRYFLWPAAGDNAQLRLARQRLFGGDPGPKFRTGACQQGLHQILRDFCRRAGPLCDECRFPSVVQSQLASPVPIPVTAAVEKG